MQLQYNSNPSHGLNYTIVLFPQPHSFCSRYASFLALPTTPKHMLPQGLWTCWSLCQNILPPDTYVVSMLLQSGLYSNFSFSIRSSLTILSKISTNIHTHACMCFLAPFPSIFPQGTYHWLTYYVLYLLISFVVYFVHYCMLTTYYST